MRSSARAEPRVGHEQVEEAGTGDVDALEVGAQALAIAAPSRSATGRGGSPSAGASSIAALVE